MALPKLDVIYHEMNIISKKETIRFRPFLVKEEKILLMALESGEEAEMVKATKQILNNCILNDDIDIEKLPLFDMQYMFLQLRAKSVGEISELKVRHPNGKNSLGDECNHMTDLRIDLSKIKPLINENHTPKIQLNDSVGISMKYPTLEILLKMENIDENEKSSVESIFDIMADCIDFIYDKDEVYYSNEHSREELIEFISSLNTQQFNKIRDFFNTMPAMVHHESYICSKCGQKETLTFYGVESFFS